MEHGAPAATVCWLMRGRVVIARPYHLEAADDFSPFAPPAPSAAPASGTSGSNARKVFEEVAQLDALMHAGHALFGEIGCALDRPRTARVTAIADSQVLVCTWELLQRVMLASGDPERRFSNLVRDAYEQHLYSQSSVDRSEADLDRLLDECDDAIDSACPHLSVRCH